MSAIPYRPELRGICGSVTATILFQQLEYWFENQGGEFYKFLAPCPGHKNYKEGDSWQEELGFSDDEFRAAFDRIGKRYRSKKEFNDDQDGHGKFMFVSYTDKRSGLTHYVRNAEAIKTTLANQVYCKSESPSYSKPTNPIPRDGKIQYREIDNSDTGRLENPIPKILAETTSETTKDYTQTTDANKKPSRITELIKQYSEQVQKVDRIALDYRLKQAENANGLQTVEHCLEAIIQAAQDPAYPKDKLPGSLSTLLGTFERVEWWAKRYKRPIAAIVHAEPDYEAQTMQELENMTDAERAARFKWYAQTGLIAPQEAVKKWKHLMPNLTQSQAS
jgi:hypothetical protein